jgi:hypothetical protein
MRRILGAPWGSKGSSGSPLRLREAHGDLKHRLTHDVCLQQGFFHHPSLQGTSMFCDETQEVRDRAARVVRDFPAKLRASIKDLMLQARIVMLARDIALSSDERPSNPTRDELLTYREHLRRLDDYLETTTPAVARGEDRVPLSPYVVLRDIIVMCERHMPGVSSGPSGETEMGEAQESTAPSFDPFTLSPTSPSDQSPPPAGGGMYRGASSLSPAGAQPANRADYRKPSPPRASSGLSEVARERAAMERANRILGQIEEITAPFADHSEPPTPPATAGRRERARRRGLRTDLPSAWTRLREPVRACRWLDPRRSRLRQRIVSKRLRMPPLASLECSVLFRAPSTA